MANKPITSSPLFGSASPKEVTDIQQEIQEFTSKAARTRAAAKDLLRRAGVPSEKDSPKKLDT
jgi:hypothetical protein